MEVFLCEGKFYAVHYFKANRTAIDAKDNLRRLSISCYTFDHSLRILFYKIRPIFLINLSSLSEFSFHIVSLNKLTGTTADSNSTIFSLFDAIKRQLWSDFIDNPLLPFYSILPTATSSSLIINNLSLPASQTATSLIQTLFDSYILNEVFDSEQSRALYICSKYIPIDLLIIRLLTNINTSNGIYETGRALYFIFGLILLRRRSSTLSLIEQVLPYLFNIKSNEFMLEPNVHSMCLLLNILLTIELNRNNDQLDDLFRVKSWKEILFDIIPKYDNTNIVNAYHYLLNNSSEELFASETLRPVNYFFGWFQTVLWMFSRTAKILKPFVKPKLVRKQKKDRFFFFSLNYLFYFLKTKKKVAQLSEYLPLQFPIEKLLSILDLSTEIEIEYISMVITRDYTRLRTLSTRTTSNLVNNQQLIINENNPMITTDVTKKIFLTPENL